MSLLIYLIEAVAGSGSRLIYKNWLSKSSLAHRVSLVGWPEDLPYQSNRFRSAQLQYLLDGVRNHEIYYRPMKPGEDTHTSEMIANGYPQDHPIPGVSLQLTAEQDLGDGTLNPDGTLNVEKLRRGVLTSIGLNNTVGRNTTNANAPANAIRVVSNAPPIAPFSNVPPAAAAANTSNVAFNTVASNAATNAVFSNTQPLPSSSLTHRLTIGDPGFF
jgi:hypothetical protein